MESIVGKILCDRYRVIQELSQTEFSSVFVAEDLDLPNKPRCQIERLQPHYDSEVLGTQSWKKILQAFMTQGNILKNLSQHPQIPQLLAFFECDREFFLVRELIDGESLASKLQRSLINEAEAISWLQEILGVLDFVHQADIAHLNIQPSGLIQQSNGRKVLTGFSSVKNAVFYDQQLLKAIVNRDFSSPEQQTGNPDLSTDIYSLGKTIIYALTGQVAEFVQAESSQLRTETSIANYNHLSIAKIRPELADILNKMVADRPEKRYQSAAEVLDELDFGQKVVTLPPPVFNNFTPVFNSPGGVASPTFSRGFNKINQLNQKSLWLLLTLPFIVALIIVFFGLDRNAYQDFLTYTNDNYQFAIKYPQTWSRRDLDDPITGEVVVFDSPPETNSDLFLEKLHIHVEALSSEPITLKQYTQTVFEQIKQAKGSEIEIYEDRKTKISQSPARMVVYSRQENGLQLRQMEAFTIKNNQVYIAIYTAERAKFSKFLNTAQKMIDSWKID